MSARFLTAYLATAALLVGFFTQAAAKPPDLPAKLEIECDQPAAPMVVKVYQVADLVIPIDNTPVSDAVPAPAPYLPSPASSPCTEANQAPVKYEYVPWPSPRAQMFPQSAYQYQPEPVSAEHVEKPSCPFGCVGKEGKDIQVQVQEIPAGNLLFGVGVNSDAGVTGNVYSAPAEDAPTPVPAPCGTICCMQCGSRPRTQKCLEEQLIKLIVSTIQPQSWENMGGSGTIDYFPLGMALVINQTPQIQEQVADLLESLRRLQDEEVAVEVRFVTVPASFYGQVVDDLGLKLIKCQKETCGGQCPAACSKACCKDSPGEGLAFLNASQVAKFYDKIQADPHTNVMQSPKMTMFNGQESTISIMDTQFFVTSMDFRWIGDQVGCFPVNEPVSTGLKMTIQPVVSADKRYVRLCWDASYTELAMPVPLCPITCITPTFKGGAKGQPEPFTMFIQQPSLSRQNVHKTVSIPDGGTVLLPAWTTCREVPEEVETPILTKIRYLSELFKKVGKHEETTTTVMLVTPRIICNSERETAKVADSEMGSTVMENLQKLEQAQRLFKKADQCRRQGQHKVAADCYHQIQRLCPGSRLAHLADRRCRQLDREQPAHGGYPDLGGVPAPSAVYLAPPPPAPATPPPAMLIPPAVYPPMPALVPVAASEAVLVPHKVHLEQEAAEMLKKYYQACSEGKWAEATQYAIQALAIDPACFCKEKDMKVFMGKSIPKLAPIP